MTILNIDPNFLLEFLVIFVSLCALRVLSLTKHGRKATSPDSYRGTMDTKIIRNG